MEVSIKDVMHCAKLANIILNSNEIKELQQDMAKILSHAKNLDQLNLEFIEPYSHSMCTTIPRRNDNVESVGFTQHEALVNAPQAANNYFLVPMVIRCNQ